MPPVSIDIRLARALAPFAARGAQSAPHLEGDFAIDALDRAALGALDAVEDDDIVQVGLAAGVSAGAYDGDVQVRDLIGRGDTGIGTLQGLDGEMVVVDGEVWSIDVDGRAHRSDPDAFVPFAVLVHLVPTTRLTLDGPLDRAGFEALLRRHLTDADGCYVVRVDGTFGPVAFRSVRRQHRPYRPLAEVLATDQHSFTVDTLDATMVGFCFPDSASDLDFAGFHLHMLAADRSTGGHVFDFTALQATIVIGRCHNVHVELASGGER